MVHHRTAVVFKVNKVIRVTMNGVQKNKVSRKAPKNFIHSKHEHLSSLHISSYLLPVDLPQRPWINGDVKGDLVVTVAQR